MWVERVDVGGFRGLRGSLELARGLTVVTGPNEAGKSSLHELLVRVLFGFAKPERRRRAGESHLDRCRPWLGGPYGAGAVLRDAGGRSLRVEWDFEQHSVVVRDANTGEDFSARVRGKREDVALGEFLLGIGLEQFRDVCCLDQAAIGPVVGSEPLKNMLQRTVETGAADIAVEDADARLAACLKDDLGVHGGHYGPLAKGPLAALENERRGLRQALEEAESGRDEIAGLARRRSVLEADRDVVAARLATTRQTLLLGEARRMSSRLETARGLAEVVATCPARPLELPTGPIHEIRDRRSERERLRTQLRRLEDQVEGDAEATARLDEDRLELAREVDALRIYADFDGSREDAARSLSARLEATSQGERPGVPARDPRLERFRRERSRLLELAGRDTPAVFDRTRLVLATIVAVVSALAGVVVHPAAFSGLALAGLIVATSRGPDRRIGTELDTTLENLGAGSLEELQRLAEDEERRVLAAEEGVRRWDEEHVRLAEAEDQLGALLDGAGAPAREPLAERVGAYLIACAKRRRLTELEGELARIGAESSQREQPRRELQRRRQELRDVEKALADAYRALGIDPGDLDLAGEELRELARRADADAALLHQAEAAQRELAGLLNGGSLDELEEEQRRASQLLREDVARVGELAGAPSDHAKLSQDAKELDTKLRAVDTEAGELAARIDERESRLADPGRLRHRMAEVEERIAHIELGVAAIRVARDELVAAARDAHRAFAPHLRQALERNLPRITSSRYDEATIDEELQIKVVVPETGRLVPVEQLSRGTQDQVYLVERLEIAALLDPAARTAPLLLDDPFDHFDEDRLRAGLDLLAEVAADRQVVLFTEEPDLVERARELCGECAVIELPGPAVHGDLPAARSDRRSAA